MTNRRNKNVDWYTGNGTTDTGARSMYTEVADGIILAVLMDIRDELQALNKLLYCPNAIEIPAILREISRKLPTKRKQTKRRRRAK